MLSKFEHSLFSKSWVDGPEGILIQGGLALIAIGTTGYILNKVFNRSPVAIPAEESPTTDNMLKNRAYSVAVKEHLRAIYAHFAGGLREQYLWLGAPLMAALSVVCLASFTSIILPATAIKTLSALECVSLYGGLVTFSGVLLFDTQKMITNAENAQDAQTLSSINESLDIYMDTINIFIRILTLLSKNDERKKKRSAATNRTN
ncbi:unnamed protein product [Rotaria sordida]|uniref:Uncharacterized protein n=1 Tax=Rotaria sordida TaxID=392033 RepID=A0A815SX39_9BILA|nr:unnamed protein product [Rotaria sordida]